MAQNVCQPQSVNSGLLFVFNAIDCLFCRCFQVGHIYTSSGSFYIQPVENYTNENTNILHKITREKINPDGMVFKATNVDGGDSRGSSEEVTEDARESNCDACNNKGEYNGRCSRAISVSSQQIPVNATS